MGEKCFPSLVTLHVLQQITLFIQLPGKTLKRGLNSWMALTLNEGWGGLRGIGFIRGYIGHVGCGVGDLGLVN